MPKQQAKAQLNNSSSNKLTHWLHLMHGQLTSRGDALDTISPDLTRAIEYDPQYLMSPYGTIRMIAESPLDTDVIAVGTDDGLIQVSRDGGASWQALESFPGVPELAQVSRLVLSAHDAQTLYVAFSTHEDWDFRPFLLKSMDHRSLLEDWQPTTAAKTPHQVQDRKELQNPCKTLDTLFRSLCNKRNLAPFAGQTGNDLIVISVFCYAKHNGR